MPFKRLGIILREEDIKKKTEEIGTLIRGGPKRRSEQRLLWN